MQASNGSIVEAAYVEHRAGLVRRLVAVTRDAEAAEDLAQEAFLRFAREVEAGRVPDDVAGWLHRVSTNLAMSRGRHLQVVERTAGRLPRPADEPDPEDVLVRRELGAAVRDALVGLTPVEQHGLLLAAHGVGGIEIAGTLGRTPGATRTMLCRARTKIRERMVVAGLAPA